jgi:hypothetical protein
VVDLVEKIEHDGEARRIQIEIAFQTLRLNDTKNGEARESPVRAGLTDRLDQAMLDQLSDPIDLNIAGNT